jgi:tagatose-1,6-bisphosphate aldolase
MTPDDRQRKLAALTRPGGGFAMVANDGRESLRGMFHKAGRPSEDADLVSFKTTVARELGPHCTAMLMDPMYGLPALAALREVAPQTGRLLAVDRFESRPDVYKTQVPTLGRAPLEDIERRSGDLSRAVGVPWVALSNGVAADHFADVISAVCRGGASGFLAGRASWSRAVEQDNPAEELASSGVSRLQTFAERVDREAVPWWVAAGIAAPPQAVHGAGRTP